MSERKLGIYKLEDKIIRHEFHLEGENYEKLRIQDQKFGMAWYYRMYQSPYSMYMIGAGTLIFPYSFLSVVQNFQSAVNDQLIKKFYVEDIYFLEGQTYMQKVMNDQKALTKILFQYFE